MQPYTYLIINFLTIAICFVYSFHPKIRFHQHFGAFLKASSLVAFVFIVWDVWFTQIGIWWFNDRYLIGIRLFGLPIEEILFFFCIPFSCVFTYFCIDKFFKLDWPARAERWLVHVSILINTVVGFVFLDNLYTTVTTFFTVFTLLYLYYIAKVPWIGKASTIYTILMPGFLSVNGVLTGTGLEEAIVIYNPDQFLNIRLVTIPIEDAVYGYSMILWNIYFFKLFSGIRNEQRIASPKDPRNKVVLVDEKDHPIGQMDKLKAHKTGKLHRAFSVFLFNGQGEMLIHQRAAGKYHGGGLWTNACCSHPQPGEDTYESATERLKYEMGLTCELQALFSFTYRVEVENNLIEHEYDFVFVGYTDEQPLPNREEVQDYRWITPKDLLQEVDQHPGMFTTWFKMAIPRVLQEAYIA